MATPSSSQNDGKTTTAYVRINPTTVKATLSIVPTNDATASISTPTAPSQAKRRPPIVVFDVSGSMHSPGRFDRCVAIVKSIIESAGSVELITYNGHASYQGLVTQFPSTIQPDGQTSFKAAYDELIDLVYHANRYQGRDDGYTGDGGGGSGSGSIVFMSDGEDTTTRNATADLARFKSTLASICREWKTSYTIHSIGVDAREADAQLLIDLSKSGTVEGTFGAFFHRNGRLSPTAAAEEQAEVSRLVSAVAGDCNATIVVFKGNSYALTSQEPVKHVFFEDKSIDCPRGTVYDEIDFFSFRLGQMVANMSTVTVPAVSALREQMNQVFLAAGRPPFSRLERKLVRQRLDPLNELVRTIYDSIHSSGSGRTLSNEIISKLNIAAREARSSQNARFIRTAVDRSDKNAVIMADEDEKMIELSRQAVPLTLEESALLSNFSCALTLSNAVELLEEGDCIGIGVRAHGAEACMFDPTMLNVTGVGAGFFSASEFLSTATRVSSSVSFNSPTSVIKDEAGHHISGVLPLYLNDRHWQMAKLHIRRMASHLCCKDPLMGTGNVVFFTYAKVYQFMLGLMDKPGKGDLGDRLDRLLPLVQETLKRVYAEYHSVIPRPESFIERPSSRVASVVLSPTALLSAYIALGLEFDVERAKLYALEETLRRSAKDATAEPRRIEEFFSFDRSVYIDPYVRQQVRDTSGNVSPVISKLDALFETVRSKYSDEKIHSLLLEAIGKIVRGEYETDAQTGELIDYGQSYDCLSEFVPVCLDDDASSINGLPAPMSAYSPERRSLIIMQYSSRWNEADYIAHYKDWHMATEDEVRAEFVAKCMAHIASERVAAVGRLVSANRSSETSAAIDYLSCQDHNVTLLERVALHHKTCYIGRNVTAFSETITSRHHYDMLRDGQYDIAPLIGYTGGPVMVRTLMDCDYPDGNGYIPNWNTTASKHAKIRARFRD